MNTTIHYCWFGSDLPRKVQANIATAKEKFPDWNIKIWRERDCPNHTYVQRMLKKRIWAYAADYMRLYALYHDGGLYLDADIKVLKSFSHELIDDKLQFLAGLEPSSRYISNGVLYAKKGSLWVKSMMDIYDDKLARRFSFKDFITGPKLITPYLVNKGIDLASRDIQNGVRIMEEAAFFPQGDKQYDGYILHDSDTCSWKPRRTLIEKLYRKTRKIKEYVLGRRT